MRLYLPELSEVGSVAVSYTLVHCLTAKTAKVHGRHCRACTLVAVGGTTLILTSFSTSALSVFSGALQGYNALVVSKEPSEDS